MTITKARIQELADQVWEKIRADDLTPADRAVVKAAVRLGIREGLDVAAQYLTDQTFGQHIPDAIRSIHIEGEETEK